ncbi:hypothetical protein E4T43_01449 [Aureobasidium subglaciale]|nr:hypothetical protein E4T43_01449 [Aureobasidium subglaciale]
MSSGRSDPYITAVLQGAQSEFDLSGKTPFGLMIALTLHAKAPIMYSQDDTFFERLLSDGGLEFVNIETHEQVERGRTDICKMGLYGQNEPSPPTATIFLQPGEVELIPSGVDLSLVMNIVALESGCTYEVKLPAGKAILYWRWAGHKDIQEHRQAAVGTLSTVQSAAEAVLKWWKDGKADTSLLLEKTSLPVFVEGEAVIIGCVGEAMQWPDNNSKSWAHNQPGYQDRSNRLAEEYRKKQLTCQG